MERTPRTIEQVPAGDSREGPHCYRRFVKEPRELLGR